MYHNVWKCRCTRYQYTYTTTLVHLFRNCFSNLTHFVHSRSDIIIGICIQRAVRCTCVMRTQYRILKCSHFVSPHSPTHTHIYKCLPKFNHKPIHTYTDVQSEKNSRRTVNPAKPVASQCNQHVTRNSSCATLNQSSRVSCHCRLQPEKPN